MKENKIILNIVKPSTKDNIEDPYLLNKRINKLKKQYPNAGQFQASNNIGIVNTLLSELEYSLEGNSKIDRVKRKIQNVINTCNKQLAIYEEEQGDSPYDNPNIENIDDIEQHKEEYETVLSTILDVEKDPKYL